MADPRYILITAATSGPLSEFEARAHLRVEESDDTIALYLAAAVEWVEKNTGRSLITQTWEAVLDAFPDDGEIPLAQGALVSVSSVKYLDAAGVEQTLAASEYQVDTASASGRVVRAPNVTWPETSEKINAVRVRFVTGTDAASVPAPVKAAILLILGHLYERREETIVGATISDIPMGVPALLSPYRLHVGIW